MSNYNRKDRFYKKAKEDGYRSRAAYKLIELNKKYRLMAPGVRVLDLGAWPGGWLQVAAEYIGDRGKAVGIDLVEIEPLSPQVLCITGDVRDEAVRTQARVSVGGAFDLCLSDMAPKLSGIPEADRAGTLACAELARETAREMLAPGGAFVCKLFKSQEADGFVKSLRGMFNKVSREELESTRATSNEFYVIGTGFRGAEG